MPVFLQVAERTELPGGYGVALLQTLLALAAVCILAWVVLRWGSRRGLGAKGTGGAVRVVERVALDPRRMLYVVRVGNRLLLLGAGDGAAPTLLTELDPGTVAEPTAPRRTSALFRDALNRARRATAQSGSAASRPTVRFGPAGDSAVGDVPTNGLGVAPAERVHDGRGTGGPAGTHEEARGAGTRDTGTGKAGGEAS